jgi:P27 family predicted phage terminase small subunit
VTKLLSNFPEPPDYLGQSAADFWRSVVKEYDLTPSDLMLLECACRHWDIKERAREQIAREGMTVPTADGTSIKTHPACAIEHHAMMSFLRTMKQLDLDAEPPPEKRPVGRPPSIVSFPAR